MADLDWIVAPGYSLAGYILEKIHEKPWKPTWNHENQSGTMKETMKIDLELWKTMKTNLEPWQNHENQPGTMENHENQVELWKTMKTNL